MEPEGCNWTAAVEGNFKVRICIDNIMASVVVHVAYQHYTLYIIVSNLIKLKSICFHCIMQVEFKDFLLPKCKCKSEIEEAIQSGRSPFIMYKVVYTIPQKQQVKPAVLKVALRGKDLELLFSCPIMREYLQYVRACHMCVSVFSLGWFEWYRTTPPLRTSLEALNLALFLSS